MLEVARKYLPEGLAGSIVAALVALACLVIALVLFNSARQDFGGRGKDKEAMVPKFFFGTAFLVAFVVLFAAALLDEKQRAWVIAGTSVFLFGALVGGAELISRYKDNPMRALLTAPGFFYVFLNAAGAAAALYLIVIFHKEVGFADAAGNWPEDTGTLVKAVLIAGSASLVFFRSAIFKFRVGDSDLAIGPSIVLDTLSTAADRAVDRNMAGPRAVLVHELMTDIAFDKAAAILSQHCVALMQNVSSEESQRIVGIVNKLRADKDIPDKIKTLNLGLALLSVVGEKVLRTAVEYLRADLQDSTAKLLNEVVSVMQSVSFDKARRILPGYCFALWPSVIPEAVQQKLAADLKALTLLSPEEAPERYKALFLGIGLARATDGATLRKAVEDLGDSIKLNLLPPPPDPADDKPPAVDAGAPPPAAAPAAAPATAIVAGTLPAATAPAAIIFAATPTAAGAPATITIAAAPTAAAAATSPANDLAASAGTTPEPSAGTTPVSSAPVPADEHDAAARLSVPGAAPAQQAVEPTKPAGAAQPPAAKPEKLPAE